MISIIIGAILIIAAIVGIIWAICRTPENLRGYYGVAYTAFFAICLVGGLATITVGIFTLVGII